MSWCVSCSRDRRYTAWVYFIVSVTVLFIPLWKLSFCICVECNTPFCYAYHFTKMLHISLHMYITVALFEFLNGQ
jgi:hypothetical protein